MTSLPLRRSLFSKFISVCIVVSFVTTMVITPKAVLAQGIIGLPAPGQMVSLSTSYRPLMLTGLTVHPENPLLLDFIVSTGNSGMNAAQVKKESDRLIKYFLACLTIPENDQWVNLSPYEKQRIVPEDLGKTVLGQDMLAQDYLLKQLTASLIYPERNLGKTFWDKVYAQAQEIYGTTQIPVNTFNKVWILPQYAKVYTHNNTVFVVKSHLKVMLDEDYLALQKHNAIQYQTVILNKAKDLKRIDSFRDSSASPQNDMNHLGSQIVRQLILPAIEQEVNTGKNFAQMRQIYNSMILAVWFKNNLKQALLTQVYADKSKTNGVDIDPSVKEKIYTQYLQAYKKGVFNYIKEDHSYGTTIPRKYFSGGLTPFIVDELQKGTRDDFNSAMASEPVEDREYAVLGLEAGVSSSRESNQNTLNQSMMVETKEQFEHLSHYLMSDLFPSGNRDEKMYKFLKERIVPELAKIYENRQKRKNSTAKGRRVILNKDDPKFDPNDPEDGSEDVKIGILAIAANPVHWGQLETALRAMADHDIDQVAILVQGDDFRKPILKKTEEDRHEMVKLLLERFGGLLVYSDWSKGNRNIGEDSTPELILRNIEAGRKGKVTWHYIVGSDHGHWDAPADNLIDDNGVRINPKGWTVKESRLAEIASLNGTSLDPRMQDSFWEKSAKYPGEVLLKQGIKLTEAQVRHIAGNGFDDLWALLKESVGHKENWEKDTLQRLDDVSIKYKKLFDSKGVSLVTGLNIREDADGVPMGVEKLKMAGLFQAGSFYNIAGRNLPGTSSTKLREVLSGQRNRSEATFIMESMYDYIMEHGHYRGLITDLPQAIRKLSDQINQGVLFGDKERKLLDQLGKWKDIEHEHGHDITPEDFYHMFFEGIDKDKFDRDGRIVQSAEPKLYVSLENVQKVFREGYKLGYVHLSSPAMMTLEERVGRIEPNTHIGLTYFGRNATGEHQEGFLAGVFNSYDRTTRILILQVSGGQHFQIHVPGPGLNGQEDLLNQRKSYILSGISMTPDEVSRALSHLGIHKNGEKLLVELMVPMDRPGVDEVTGLTKKGILFANLRRPDLNSAVLNYTTDNGQEGSFNNSEIFAILGMPEVKGLEALPVIVDGTPYVNFREFLSSIGATVTYNKNARTLQIQSNRTDGLLTEGIQAIKAAFMKHQWSEIVDIDGIVSNNTGDYTLSFKPIETSLSLPRADRASLAPGGIDLNSRHLNMESSGEKVNISFDPAMIAQFKRGDFSGVRIQILDVVPISLWPLLGLREVEESGQLAKA